jgi:DGQHR domain-containing protein
MKIPAFVVHQWLKPEWDAIKFVPAPPRGKPEPYFFLFSVSAYTLRRLSGIYRRDPTKPPAEDMGIQRRHLPERSQEILRYIQSGFPLSRIDPKKLVDLSEVDSLRMPGWLPTAVVANILVAGDKRGPKARAIAGEDLINVHYSSGSSAEIELPRRHADDSWQPRIHPIEIIDGQHRLWALEEPEEEELQWTSDFRKKIAEVEIPVVAFHGVDRTWQAYLFYTINQLPRKIDQSLVFDLYPLLRDSNWLLRFGGPNIYRETRAQDIVILLWSHPESPWQDRIIRLGGRTKGQVTQASFIRSLMASFIRRWQERTGRLGGLFGAPLRSHETRLPWGREQQAAFLIVAWQELRDAVEKSKASWAKALIERCLKQESAVLGGGAKRENVCRTRLFTGEETLIATDQGVRGYMTVLNDLLVTGFREGDFDLTNWDWSRSPKFTKDENAVSDAIKSLRRDLGELVKLVQQIAAVIADFDWRLPSAVSPTDDDYSRQASYRGSGGYRILRRNLLLHLREVSRGAVLRLSENVIENLGLDSEDDEAV